MKPKPTTAAEKVLRNPTNKIQPEVVVKRVSREPHTISVNAIPVPRTMMQLNIITGVTIGINEFMTEF
jgi:hypothetical protein